MKKVLALAVAGLITGTVQAAPSADEMWKIIQQQQREIELLKQQLKSADQRIETTTVKVQETSKQVEATAEAVEASSGKLAKAAEWVERTSVGGYGELHYNNLEDQRSVGAKSDRNEFDFHRFVLFFNHRFSDRTRLYTELELEHSLSGDGTVAGKSKPGEVELEQAYIEHDLTASGSQRVKAGLFLMPVGILNETHEPDTFYGVERNNVESQIIPTTWWEGGFGFNGEIAAGLSYDAAVTSGLKLTGSNTAIRSGRQKVAEADGDSLAYTGRLKYTGVPGLELASTVQHQTDLYQEDRIVSGGKRTTQAWLYEAHAAYQGEHFGLRALFAQWDIDDEIERVLAGADQQQGWYVEPSWRFNPQWGVFARYSEWDNRATVNSLDTEFAQVDIGVNYWLEPHVVFKLDLQNQNAPANQRELDGFNLGVGYSF
jgi:hypothetical protein